MGRFLRQVFILVVGGLLVLDPMPLVVKVSRVLDESSLLGLYLLLLHFLSVFILLDCFEESPLTSVFRFGYEYKFGFGDLLLVSFELLHVGV